MEHRLKQLSKKYVLEELTKRGVSLRGLGRSYGFGEINVLQAFRKHVGEPKSNPCGVITTSILSKIDEIISSPIEDPDTDDSDQAVNQ
jgi:hypothetical protein